VLDDCAAQLDVSKAKDYTLPRPPELPTFSHTSHATPPAQSILYNFPDPSTAESLQRHVPAIEFAKQPARACLEPSKDTLAMQRGPGTYSPPVWLEVGYGNGRTVDFGRVSGRTPPDAEISGPSQMKSEGDILELFPRYSLVRRTARSVKILPEVPGRARMSEEAKREELLRLRAAADRGVASARFLGVSNPASSLLFKSL
jgi:hypothetical protein